MSRVVMTGWREAEQRVLRRLNGLGPPAMLQALNGVGGDLVGQYRESIDRGRSPRHRFPRLSPRYARRKAKRWGPKPILVASGSMYDSLTAEASSLAPNRYKLEVGARGVDDAGVSNARKALWHIEGTRTMPFRDFGRVRRHLVSEALSRALRAAVQAGAPIRA